MRCGASRRAVSGQKRSLVAAEVNLTVSFLYTLLVVMVDRRNVRGGRGLHEP